MDPPHHSDVVTHMNSKCSGIDDHAEGGHNACASERGMAMPVRLAVAECVKRKGMDV